ncbi:MAG: YdcF family protein [Mastigocoleus sp. MO_188.B34]|nr:YdcF family protein [Mastigocoleus sp. MO_188.B34]MDJ0697475.1 YdcF family protein [Mastigocoleus sp. MO_188.B34]
MIQKYWHQLIFLFFIIFGSYLIVNFVTLISASSQSADAIFVLGGSIQREIYVGVQAAEHPETPIIISSGSQDPCIKLIFQKYLASMQSPSLQSTILNNVWLEKCAKSTFGNFYYGIPILKRWHVRKVKLITSSTHLPRAKWMAQILLGSHGIWVEPDIINEKGVPGNREYWLKTSLDVTRSLFWAVVSQFREPQCGEVVKLADVDMDEWVKRGFKCERQVQIKIPQSKGSPR